MNPQFTNNRNQIFNGERNGEIQTAVITYLTIGKAQSSSNFTAIIGIATGVIFAIFGFLFSIVLVFTIPPAAILTGLFSIIGLFMVIGFGGWLVIKRNEKLQLTPNSLFSKSRIKKTELHLTQINRIYPVQKMVWRESDLPVKRTYQIFYWCVRIEATANNFIELDLTQPNWLGSFDVSKLLRDLLPHLPISTQVDPYIYSYLHTGTMS